MTDKSARALAPAGFERRTFGAKLTTRTAAGAEAHVVAGCASSTESPYEMADMFGPYTEVITRGAFGKTLAESPKVQLLVNHGGLSLASTTAGTLRLDEGDLGLTFDADLNPKRTDSANLIAALQDGAVDECSFAFRVVRQAWSPDYSERRIDEVSLHRGDVSVVNLGANPNTPVAMRAADLIGALDHLEGELLIEAVERIAARAARAGLAPVNVAEVVEVVETDDVERLAAYDALRLRRIASLAL